MDCLLPQLNSSVRLTFLMWEDVRLFLPSLTHTRISYWHMLQYQLCCNQHNNTVMILNVGRSSDVLILYRVTDAKIWMIQSTWSLCQSFSFNESQECTSDNNEILDNMSAGMKIYFTVSASSHSQPLSFPLRPMVARWLVTSLSVKYKRLVSTEAL